jgi:hypothetical protein
VVIFTEQPLRRADEAAGLRLAKADEGIRGTRSALAAAVASFRA